MSDKYTEVSRGPGQLDRIPKKDAKRVGAQYVDESAVRDLEVSMGDQADEMESLEEVTEGVGEETDSDKD